MSGRLLVVRNDEVSDLGVMEEPLRAAGHELEWWLPGEGDPRPGLEGHAGVISLGGRVDPDADDEHPWLAAERDLIAQTLAAGIPYLGVCLGAQLLVQVTGGEVTDAVPSELGWVELSVSSGAANDPVLGALHEGQHVLQWHSYGLRAPASARVLARSDAAEQALRVQRAWGVQFHAEIDAQTAHEWSRDGADQLADGDVDPDDFRAQTAAHLPASTTFGRDLAERFSAEVVRAGVVP